MSSNQHISYETWRKALVEKQTENVVRVLESSVVAICGLGGLGSNVALMLARAGIKKLILIDFDKVSVTNLHRQQYKASQIGQFKTEALKENLSETIPWITCEIHTEKITEENVISFIQEANVICEAFDNAESKAMLVNKVLETFPEKFLVAASGMAGFETLNSIQTKKITDHFYIAGDFTSGIENTEGLLIPRVIACAAHETMTIIQKLCKKI